MYGFHLQQKTSDVLLFFWINNLEINRKRAYKGTQEKRNLKLECIFITGLFIPFNISYIRHALQRHEKLQVVSQKKKEVQTDIKLLP